MKRYAGLFIVLLLLADLISCSLKYDQGHNVEDVVPEFAFKGTVMTRYEDAKKNLTLKVDDLEQYKDGNSVFAKGVEFEVYDDDQSVSMDGTCGYLSANTRAEVYEMFDSIKLNNKKENMSVSGRSFHWNGKNEQLVAGRNDTVVIEKDGMTIYGSGFSASGASSSYSFNSVVTGNIETEDGDKKDEKIE